MLKKTVEWDFIMEAIVEKLRNEGLEVVRTIEEEGRIGDGYMELEVKVLTAMGILTLPGIRSPF